MLVKTAGVVIKRIPYTDHSAVVHIFTESHGIIPFLVQGLGKSKSKSAYYQSGQLLELVFYDKQQGGLKRIKEVQVHAESPIYLSMVPQQLQLFYTELTSLTLTEHQTDSDLFHLLKSAIIQLKVNPNYTFAPIKFVLQLCQRIGYQIDAQVHFPHLEGMKEVFEAILNDENPPIDRSARRNLLNRLVQRIQTEAFPEKSLRSLAVIDDLFE